MKTILSLLMWAFFNGAVAADQKDPKMVGDLKDPLPGEMECEVDADCVHLYSQCKLNPPCGSAGVVINKLYLQNYIERSKILCRQKPVTLRLCLRNETFSAACKDKICRAIRSTTGEPTSKDQKGLLKFFSN